MAGTPVAYMAQASMAPVNHYYGGGWWNCGAAAIAAGAAAVTAGAAIGAAAMAPYAVGSVVVSVPPGCAYQNTNGINYYVCAGTGFSPSTAITGSRLYYRVVHQCKRNEII
jgi:hypothetical protein